MTKINKMVMHGFKSFARRTEMVFEDKFNCVLGPNGSGKSNVLDSLCFVLGKGSAKGLRAEKSSNLIYNGGKTKKASKFGSVSIYFDNKDREFPVDTDEVAITRIIKSSGQSVYKINEENKTRQQVLELLSAANIDPDGYNIILQGDIVRIVEMSPTERRKIIEEIAGISVYEDKKQKTLAELNKVESKLSEADIILKERETNLKELKKERDQALKFKNLKSKVESNKASYVKIQIDKKESEKANYDKLEKELNENISKLQQEINEYKEHNKKLQEEIDKINKEVEQRGEKDQVELHKEIENLRVKIGTDESRLQTIKNEIEKIHQRKKQLQDEEAELDKKIENIKSEQEELKEYKNKKNQDLEYFEKRISEFKEKHKVDDVGDIEKSIENIDAELEQKQQDLQSLREEQQNLFREKDKIELQLNTIEEKIQKVDAVAQENKKQMQELKDKRQEFKKITLDLNKRLNDDSSMAAEIGSLRSKLHEKQDKLARLEAQNNAAQESVQAEESVKQIVKQKNKIPGIFGVVSELGNVNSKYSLALEIAAGSKIKSIVVDTDTTAAQCIRYLKENRLGTAAFVPLNKIKAPAIDPKLKKLTSVNGVHDFAVNLVSFDNKLKKAFEYVFGSTLVVDSMDVARRIGIGAVRMVTLEGDIAEGSGVMRGGHRVNKRRMSFKQKEATAEIDSLTEEVQQTQHAMSTLEKRRDENERKISELREQKAQLEGEIIKLEKSLHVESGVLELNKSQKKEMQERLEEVDKRLREVQNSISEANKGLAMKKSERQQLRNQISQMRDPKIMAELSTFEEQKSKVKNEIMDIDNKIKNNQMQIDNIKKKKKEKYAKIQRQAEKEEEGFISEQNELKETVSSAKQSLEEKEEQEKEFYSQFKNLFEKRNKLADEMKQNDEQIAVKTEKMNQQHHKLNNASLESAGIKAKLSSLHEEFGQYKDVEVDTSRNESVIKREINDFEKMLENIGNVNLKALEIYEEVEQEYQNLMEKKRLLEEEKKEIHKMMDEIETKKKNVFLQSFEELRKHFKGLFNELSSKGDAELVLENPDSPFEGGVTITVKITSKKYLDIRSLSGGEKSMTALAFIFSIQEHNPASFYVLDEVDAALDKHNSEKLASLLKKYSNKAQYIIISHNDSIISEANVLYGVSMNEHSISKVVSLQV